MKKTEKYTYDTIQSDSFPPTILIRFGYDGEDEADLFETLQECRKSVNNNLNMNVYISSEILKTIL